MARGNRIINYLKSPKKAAERLREKHASNKKRKTIEACEEAIELYFGTKNPLSDFVARELIRFYQIAGEGFLKNEGDTVKKWEDLGFILSEKKEKRLRELDEIKRRISKREDTRAIRTIKGGMIQRVIIVPVKSPLNKRLFPKNKIGQLNGIKFRDAVLLPEQILQGTEAQIRAIIRHELMHAIMGKGELTAYAFSYREQFERTKSVEELRQEAGSLIFSLVETWKKMREGEEKEYMQKKILGTHAALKAVELSKRFGKEAARRFLTRIFFEGEGIIRSEQIVSLAQEIERDFEAIARTGEKK